MPSNQKPFWTTSTHPLFTHPGKRGPITTELCDCEDQEPRSRAIIKSCGYGSRLALRLAGTTLSVYLTTESRETQGLRQRPLLGTGTRNRAAAGVVGGELFRRAGIDHRAVVEHIGVVGDLERHARVLLDQQHRDALVLHLL